MIELEGNRVYKTEENVRYYFGAKLKVVLETDKPKIKADGIDLATITAKVFDYENLYQVGFNDPITFEMLGSKFTLQAKNGQCSIEVTGAEIGLVLIEGYGIETDKGVVHLETY